MLDVRPAGMVGMEKGDVGVPISEMIRCTPAVDAREG